MILLFLHLACQSETTQPPLPTEEEGVQTPMENLDRGQQHPPIPADNPIWEWDAKGFVPDHGWFGEHNWTDVRMRVLGHLSIAYRDLARSYAMVGDFKTASQTYQQLAALLRQSNTTSSQHAEQIRQILLAAADRDHEILLAIDNQQSFPFLEGLAALRARYYQFALQSEPTDSEVQQLQQDLRPFLQLRTDLNISGFQDFTDRHQLRVRLFSAYADSVNPLYIDDPWDYWHPQEIQKQATALSEAVSTLQQSPQSDIRAKLLFPKATSLPALSGEQETAIIEEFGRLPTGDTLIDTAGQPGPMGIGSLMELDHTDAAHRIWLLSKGREVLQHLSSAPQQSVSVCQKAISELDEYDHGSRFYNVKQFRNACVRQLARAEKFALAHSLFMQSFPLHHQDWACPNREGLLLAISGRLLIKSGQMEAGRAELQKSIEAGTTFLQQVSLAEQGKLNGPRPPFAPVGSESHPHKPPHGKPQKEKAGQPPPIQHHNQRPANGAHSPPQNQR